MTRYIAIIVGTATSIDPERLRSDSGVEVYQVDGPDAEHNIDMALLNDLVRPVKLVFVGGEDARFYAELYHAFWTEDGPNAVAEVLRCWDMPNH